MREIVLDTETTGLNPKKGDRVIEIGCVELIDKIITGENYHIYLNPCFTVSPAAYNVHGLSNEFLSDQPLFKDVVDEFLDFIKGDTLIIHNANFDIKFLNNELKLASKFQLRNKVIDTLKIAREKFPNSAVNLDALCKKLNVSNFTRDKHGALLDSEILAAVYLKMVVAEQNSLTFTSKNKDANSDEENIQRINFPQRNYDLNAKEKEQHSEMLKLIKDPIWNKSE